MVKWGWPFRRGEDRAAGLTDEVVNLLLARARAADLSDADGLGAVEMAGGLMGRCFASAEVRGGRGMLNAAILERIGRQIVRSGEAVFAIDPDGMMPVSEWDIRGGPVESQWGYRCHFTGPSLTTMRFLPSAAVAHVRINTHPARPWEGRAPWRVASSTASTAAAAEASAHAEASQPSARIAPVPSPDSEQRDSYAATLKKGGLLAVAAATNPIGTGGQEPASRWSPGILQPAPTAGHVELRSKAAADVLSSCGISPALFSEHSDGTGKREAFRQMLHSVVQPWARLVERELSVKLEDDVTLRFDGLFAADLSGRARAFQSMVGGGMDVARAAGLAGLMAVEE